MATIQARKQVNRTTRYTAMIRAQWKTPQDVKKAHPNASILKGGRVVFNIKANDYRLIAVVQYENGVTMIRFFGSHEETTRLMRRRCNESHIVRH